MKISPVFLQQFKIKVERILHVKGNFSGKVLEMTVVMDTAIPKEEMTEILPELLKSLKKHSQVFQNVRFNAVTWQGDEQIKNKVCPMMQATLSSFYEEYEQVEQEKRIEPLIDYLKFYHARSKLVIVLTKGDYIIQDEAALESRLQPFLGKKMMYVRVDHENCSL